MSDRRGEVVARSRASAARREQMGRKSETTVRLLLHQPSMFGPFRQSATAFGGLLWYGCTSLARTAPRPTSKLTLRFSLSRCRKSPWRMSKTRKMRARLRLKAVDDVIATVEASGVQTHSLVRLSLARWPGSRSSCIASTGTSTSTTNRAGDAPQGQVHHFLADRSWLPQVDAQGAQMCVWLLLATGCSSRLELTLLDCA